MVAALSVEAAEKRDIAAYTTRTRSAHVFTDRLPKTVQRDFSTISGLEFTVTATVMVMFWNRVMYSVRVSVTVGLVSCYLLIY